MSEKMDRSLPENADKLVRRGEVERLTGLSRSHIYALMKVGKFPTQVSISPGSVRWKLSEITAWMDNLPGRKPGQMPWQPCD